MTNEEAIKELKRRCIGCDALIGGNNDCDDCEYRMAIEALEKQIPMKPTHSYSDKCPICNNEVFSYDVEQQIFCSKCGQKINWE